MDAGTNWKQAYRPQRKARLEDIAEIIRETVSMDDVVSVYAPEHRPRGRRIPCPIHQGEGYNLSYTAHGFRCFVCGASGDVIAFVKDVLGLSTRADAMRRINQDLRLNLPIDGDVRPSFSAEAERRRQDAKRRRDAQDAWESHYNALWDDWARQDSIIRAADIKDPTEAWLRAAAIDRKTRIEYELLCLPEKPR